MKQHAKLVLLPVAALLLPIGTCGADTFYKSVDEEGRVTYSSQPPPDATEVESLQVEPGPSEEETEEAREQAKKLQQEVDAMYDELVERRRREAQALKEALEAAERERSATELNERLQRIEESLSWPANAYPYYWRPGPWWTRHPLPRPPIHPPPPTRPVHRIYYPIRPTQSHITSTLLPP
jgi:hypothetical protein